MRALLVSVVLALAACRPPATGTEESPANGDSSSTGPTDDGGSGPDTRSEPPIVNPPAEPVMVDTFAGSATNGEADGAPLQATFDNPVGVLVDPSGTLLVTEYDGGRVRKIPKTGATTTFTRGLYEPFALLRTEDALYIQTDRDQRGEKTSRSGTIWRQDLNGDEPVVFFEGLGRPRSMVRLFDGRVILSDRDRHRLFVLNLETKALTVLAGSGTAGLRDARGLNARFNDPYGIALLPDGNILVADHGNHVIRKVTLEGDVTVYAGDGNPGMRDDGDKLLARFDGPIDVAVDVAGNAYVSDGGNHRIRRITTAGVVETIAGDGQRGHSDGIGESARFYGQEQIEIAPDGKTLYVADGNGGDASPYNRIRRIKVP